MSFPKYGSSAVDYRYCPGCQVYDCTCTCADCVERRRLVEEREESMRLDLERIAATRALEALPVPPPSPPPAITLIKSPAPIATAYCPTCGLGMRICVVRDVRVLQHASPSCESFEKLTAPVIYARTPWIEVPRG